MLAAIEGAQRQILFETYIWKGDEVGERFKAALADAADRGVEVYCIYDGFANLVVEPAFKRFPPIDEGAALPGLRRRLAVLRPAPLRPRPPQDPRRRRRGRVRRRLQHRVGVRHRVARHARPDHRARRLGPRAGVRRLLEPAPAPAARRQRAAAAARDRRRAGSRRSGSTATCRGCGCSRSGRCTSRRSTGPAEHLADPGLLHPRPGLRRRADERRPARGRRPAAAAREVQPHRGRLDLARLLRPAARRRGPDLPLPRRDGARQDRHHRRHVVDGRHRQHRPAQPARATTRSTSRSSTDDLAAGDGEDLRARPVQLHRAHPRRVGGPRRAPPVHRADAAPLRPLL